MPDESEHIVLNLTGDPDAKVEIDSAGLIVLGECKGGDGYHVGIRSGDKIVACARRFATVDDALDAARQFLRSLGFDDVEIGKGYTPGEPN
jgi:hypothetical protein